MTVLPQVFGRATRRGRAAGRRFSTALPAPVVRVVLAVALAGIAAAAAVVWAAPWPGGTGRLFVLDWLPGPSTGAALLILTCVGELVAVRLRRQDAVEELTLLDPVVLLNVLLLPPRQAILVSLAGILLAYVIRRRAAVKALFNIGAHATAGSTMILLLHGTVGGHGDFGLRLLAAMTLATAGFVVVNVVCISLLLGAMRVGRPLELMRQYLGGSGLTLVSTVALAATGVSMAVHTPLLLPVTVLPAVAITYAYRAAATEVEERERSSRVLAFSQVLASSPERNIAVTEFLRLARDAFFADDVLAVFDSGEVLALDARSAEPQSLEQTAAHRRLVELAGGGVLLRTELPAGWASAMLAPLEAGGGQVGVVAVGRRSRARLRPADLTLLTPLASALAVALRNAEHLAQLVEETSKLRAVVDQSSDGILVLDGAGVVQLWNPALERLSGRSEEAALGTPLAQLMDSRDREGNPLDPFAEGHRRLSPGSPRGTVDSELIRPDGERRSLRWAHAATFDESGLVRDVVNVHDLTRERQVERMKSDFVAMVSHELRTPVTPLKGYADLLRSRGDSMPPEKRARALDVIADRAGHLARLVEDLLLASNVSSDKEPARSVVIGAADLTALTTRAMEDFASASGRLRTVTPAAPVPVACDSVRAIQVLTNLISNALKYSEPQCPVEVLVEQGDGEGRVTVRDHGRGLPEDQLERIFEKFHRVEDPMVMSTSGTGLGLYIARHLARAMHGDLVVASALGEGSRFTFSLPLAEDPDGSG